MEALALSQNTEQLLEHLALLHGGDSDGWITIGTKNTKRRNQAGEPWVQYHRRYPEIMVQLSLFGLKDTYISLNTFFAPARKAENVRQFRAFYVDLDVYKIGLTQQETLELLEREVFDRKVPRPTLVVDSGRGLYLQWLLTKPAPFAVRKLWQAIENHLVDSFKNLGVDPQVRDAARVMRLAGTVNSKAGRTVRILRRYERTYNLDELARILPPLPQRKPKKQKPEIVRQRNLVRLLTLRSLYFERACDLDKLVKLRGGTCTVRDKAGALIEGATEGQRELILFLYRYWLCFIYDPQTALERTLALNQLFREPLPVERVMVDTASAERVYEEEKNQGDPPYHYKNKTLIELLNISAEEQEHLATIISRAEKKRRDALQARQARRNENGLTKREQAKVDKLDAVRELLAKGLKQIEIARELGVSYRYVKKLTGELQKSKKGN